MVVFESLQTSSNQAWVDPPSVAESMSETGPTVWETDMSGGMVETWNNGNLVGILYKKRILTYIVTWITSKLIHNYINE